jgi:POT family proton-dependent oligopeptide transporter
MGVLFLTLIIIYTAILQKLVYGVAGIRPWLQSQSDLNVLATADLHQCDCGNLLFHYGTEYVYNQALKSLKSVVRSESIATVGLGACMAMAFTPISKDPHLASTYSSLAVAMAMITVLFSILFEKGDGYGAVYTSMLGNSRRVYVTVGSSGV